LNKSEFLVAPIPIANRAIGIGIVPVVAYVFPTTSNPASPPSTVALTGIYTSTKTYGFGLGGKLILKEDEDRVTFVAGAARARYEFFGIGSSAGSAGQSLWLSQHGQAVL